MDFIVSFTAPLVRRSVIAYWRHFVGIRFVLVVAMLGAFVAFRTWKGDRSWEVGVMGAVAVVGVAAAGYSFMVTYLRAMGAFRRLDNGAARIQLAAEFSRFESAGGAIELRWKSVKSVRRFKDLWLIVFGPYAYFTVPLEGVPPEALDFILERVRSAGGKVA